VKVGMASRVNRNKEIVRRCVVFMGFSLVNGIHGRYTGEE
jgi:hypothetical protein